MSRFSDLLPPRDGNAIWEALDVESRSALEAASSEVHLSPQQLLSAEDEGVRGLYFPISCVVCRLVSLPEGTTVKVSLVGREGMVGIPALLGGSMSTFRTVVQMEGRARFVPRAEARAILELPGMATMTFRYLLLLLREVALTAACNRSHRTTQRLARWLLLIQDRADLESFPLTHESLSAMLGVRRESVSVSAGELRGAGAIDYRRASVIVTSRSELEARSCSCYAAIVDDYSRFLLTELKG